MSSTKHATIPTRPDAPISTTAADPQITNAPTMAEPQVPIAQSKRRIADLNVVQRNRFLTRLAELATSKKEVEWPLDISMKSFLHLFDNDSSIDVESSNVLVARTTLTRREVSRLVASATGIKL